MKKRWKRWALGLLVLLAGIQLVPVDRSNPAEKVQVPAPAPVRAILERSCFDCHSNRTRWPWYSYVAPASWLVAKHVHDGRKDLNLTEWPLMDTQGQQFFLNEMKEQVKGGTMPLDSYLWMHRGARLSDEERQTLLTWIDEEVLLLSDPGWP